MATTLPINKGDAALKYGDTGPGVEKLQKFLATLPEVKKQQAFLADFGQSFSFTDANIKGNFEKNTRLFLADYQKKNKEKIKKIGEYSNEEFDNIVGLLDWATWRVIAKEIGETIPEQKAPEKKEEKTEKPAEVKSPKLPDPAGAKQATNASHYVKTKDPKSRLALRLDAAYVKVGKNAWEDNDKKGKLVIMMPNDTLLKVIDPHLGYECQWHQVEVVDPRPIYSEVRELQKKKKVYAFAEFVHPLQGTKKLLATRCSCAERSPLKDDKNRKTPFPEWQKLDECQPFYDEWTCRYYITIETEYTSMNSEKFELYKTIALERGVYMMLGFYNKQSDVDFVEGLLDSYKFAEVPENGWFLDERPGSKLKFLVSIPGKYFNAIPEAVDFLEDLAVNGKPLPKGWKTSHFYSNTLKKNIELVAKRFEEYHQDVKKWKGKRSISLLTEAKRLRAFVPRFEQFLILNGTKLREKEEDKIEFGFGGECFELLYALINVEEKSIPLRIGWDCFLQSEPIRRERTLGYVFYLEEMVREIKSKERRSWIEFIQAYSCPQPTIIPDSDDPKTIQIVEGPKTTSEKEREDEEIHDPLFKMDVLTNRKIATDFVGDPILSCENLEDVLSKIVTIEDLYKEVLNKININDISGLVASCIAADFAPPELMELGCDFVLDKMPIEELKRVLDIIPAETAINVYNQMSTITAAANVTEADRMKQSIKDVVPKDQLCKGINDFDPSLIKSFVDSFSDKKDLVKSLPKPPTITLPDNLFTEDIMPNIGAALVDAAKTMLSAVLMELVKEALRKFCSICNSSPPRDENYGDENLNDLLGPRGDTIISFVADPDLAQALKNLFDDLSALLLPSELCALLEGNPSQEVITVITELIRKKYPELSEYIESPSNLVQLFVELGQFIDDSVCQKIADRVEDVTTDLCEEKKDMRFCLYKNRLDSEQIESLLNRIKENNKQRLMVLAQFDDSVQDILSSNILGTCGNSLFDNATEPEAVEKLNNDVLNTVFDGVQSVFDADVMGYVSIITILKEPVEKFDVEAAKFERSYNARRKALKDIDEKDTSALLADPSATGIGSDENRVAIAPQMRSTLQNTSNYFTTNGVNKLPSSYSFKTSNVNLNEKIEAARNKINQAGLTQFAASVVPDFYTIEDADKITEDADNCPPVIATDSITTVTDPMVAANITIVPPKDNENVVQFAQYPYAEMKDVFRVVVNDVNDVDQFVIESTNNIPVTAKRVIDELDIKFDSLSTPQQDVFAKYVVEAWKPFVEEKEDLLGEFQNYAKTGMFHRINEDFIKQFAVQVSRSPLFKVDNFDRVEWITDPNLEQDSASQNCSIKANESFLQVEKQKDEVRDTIDKNTNSCIVDSREKSALFEETNANGIVKMIVRLFVLENFFKGIFVFSEFRAEEIAQDKVIVRFISDKIVASMKRIPNNFYEDFMAQIKKAHEDENQEESLTENPSNDERLKNELDPDYGSGLTMLQKYIREEIVNVSENIDQIVGSNTKDIADRFVNYWLNELPLPTRKQAYTDQPMEQGYIEEKKAVGTYMSRFWEDVDPEKNSEKWVVKQGYYTHGGFYLEKYVRVTSEDGKQVNYLENPQDFYTPSGVNKCGHLGLRLMYVPSLIDDKLKSIVSDFSWTTKVQSEFACNLEDGRVHTFPLLAVEDDEDISSGISFNDDKSIKKLKGKFIQSDEFKMMFEFVFPLKRYLSLTTIYNIAISSATITGVDNVFDNSKEHLKALFETFTAKDDWWKQETPSIDNAGGNVGARAAQMKNLTTKGPLGFGSLAAMTIPLLIKGLAENFDPSYRLIKELGLPPNWASVPAVAPINIFGPIPFGIGWGPPIGPYGVGALSVGLLPGEKEQAKQKDADKKRLSGEENCDEEE